MFFVCVVCVCVYLVRGVVCLVLCFLPCIVPPSLFFLCGVLVRPVYRCLSWFKLLYQFLLCFVPGFASNLCSRSLLIQFSIQNGVPGRLGTPSPSEKCLGVTLWPKTLKKTPPSGELFSRFGIIWGASGSLLGANCSPLEAISSQKCWISCAFLAFICRIAVSGQLLIEF